MRNYTRFLRRLRRNRGAVLGSVIVACFLLMALAAPWIAPHDPLEPNAAVRLQPPNPRHLMGTDELGRDILSRVMFGARVSLTVGLISVGISCVFGTVLGLVAGFIPSLDSLIMRLVDVMLAFPGMLLAIAIVAMLGPGLYNAMIAVGIFGIPDYVRVVRGCVLSVKENQYVEAARSLGLPTPVVLYRHVLPNVFAPIIVLVTFGIASAILWAAGLSFLGLGAQPPFPEWGLMLSQGRHWILRAWWVATFPGLAITLVILGFNLLGDGLRDALDPRLKQ
ncbi:MAG: ABC transporter permease [Bacillota bacterium]|nr:ABC transporter permease [Bacillota bacterium]